MQTIIDKFYGGLSTGKRLGPDGSFLYGLGLNYKDQPDAITANLALVKDSGTTVTGLIKWAAYDSVGGNHYYVDDGGKIYKRTSAGAWSVLQTTSNCSGQGLEVFNDYLWYTQNSQLGRYGLLSGTPSFTDNWQTSLNGTTDWRPIKSFLNMILVGNGRYLATVDSSSVYTAQRLTFPLGWYVRDIDVMGDYAVIAVNDAEDETKATRGILFLWGGSNSTFEDFSELNEGGGISSIIANQDSVFINGGIVGNYYIYTGKANKIKRIPYVGRGKTAFVFPGANCNFEGMAHFGISDGTSTTAYRGVYSWGQPDKDYQPALNFEYPISTGTVQGTGVQIGCIQPYGNQIFVSWKDATTYGVDLLSTSTLQTSLTYESRVISFTSETSIRNFAMFFEPLASGESLTLKYKADSSSSWTTVGTATYATDGAVTYKWFPFTNSKINCLDIQLQVTLAGTSTMPTVNKLLVDHDDMTVPISMLIGKGFTQKFNLIKTSTGLTSVTYESDVISLPRSTSFYRFKLFTEKLVSGDSITLKVDKDRVGSYDTTLGTMTYAADGALTYKLLSGTDFRATEVQLQLTLSGTSAVPLINSLIIEAESDKTL